MDQPAPGDKDRRVRDYDELFTIGLGTAATALALLSGAGKLKTVFSSFASGTPTLRSVLPAILFLLTLLLGVAWFVSGKHELQLLARYYGAHAPLRSFSTLPIVIFVAIVIVLLSYFADHILIYASLYSGYLLFAVCAGWLASQHVLRAINDGKTDTSIPQSYREEIYRYYVLRPSGILGYICGAITFLAITLAVLARNGNAPAEREHLETYSYLAMCLGIGVGEVTVWSWRARLYRKTRDV